MSKIHLTFSPHADQKLTVESEVDSEIFEFPFDINLYALRVDISSLLVSLTLTDLNGNTVFTRNFPDAGTQLESTDQPRLFSNTLRLNLNHTYQLAITASLNGENSSAEFEFTTPLPYKENDSWLWDEGANAWVPPVPKPGLLFYWDEFAYQAGEDPWAALPAGVF